VAAPSRRRFFLGGLGIALAAYAILLGFYMGAYAGGSDSSGYLNNARLLRSGHVRVPRRFIEGLPPENLKSSFAYVPLGFSPVGQRDMVPTYPIGLSLLIAGLSSVTGTSAAPHVTMWLHALLGVILMFAFAREVGFPVGTAAFGALLLALSPLYLYLSLQAMSDMPALVWTMAAVYFAWRSRKHDRWALAAGVAVAIAVLVRPTDILILAPVAVCLGLSARRWLWLGLGGAPGALFLALFNLALYGKMLTTGYGDVGSAFSREYASLSLAHYVRWLPVLLTPGLGLALVAPWVMGRTRPRLLAVMALWILLFTGFYTFYYHTHEKWWYLRFVLPAFPPAILAMLFAGQALASRWPARIAAGVGVLLAVAVVAWDGAWTRHFDALAIGRGESVYPQLVAWSRSHLPANAVIASMQASGALLYYSKFTFIRWDYLPAADFSLVAGACMAAGRPLYALLRPYDLDQHALDHMPGHWTQVGFVDSPYGNSTIWKWEPAPAATH
jgi:hypothetical protein